MARHALDCFLVQGFLLFVSLRIAKDFFSLVLGIENKTGIHHDITSFDNALTAMINGDEKLNIIAAPNQVGERALLACEEYQENPTCWYSCLSFSDALGVAHQFQLESKQKA